MLKKLTKANRIPQEQLPERYLSLTGFGTLSGIIKTNPARETYSLQEFTLFKSLFRHIALLILLLLAQVSSLFAQSSYPISVNPVLIPPYTLSLSDYCAFGSQKLMIYLHANDLNLAHLPVKLQIKFEAPGVTITNTPTIATNPIYIDGGATTILYGEDLTDYFKIDNLAFSGYTKEAYRKTGQLPEGFYRISIAVLHFQTNRVISNIGVVSAWIVTGHPPELRYPLDAANVGENSALPLNFSWLPCNVGSVAAMGNIQYKFELWEMRVANSNPNVVVASLPVFYEYTTYSTTYNFLPSAASMEPGMRYAWRVTASDPSGTIPFEQNGHSQVRTFTYKAPCDSVANLAGKVTGRNLQFTWDANAMHTSYNVEMQNPATSWYRASESFENSVSFFGLEYGSTYKIRVQSVCNNDPTSVSDFTQWQSVTIPQHKPAYDTATCPNCGCSDERQDVTITNFNLRTDLAEDDTIMNKYKTTRLIIKKITGSSGNTYEGICYFWAEIWGLKIACNFRNLQVNTDNVFVNLELESIYDPALIADIDKIEETIDNLTTLFENPLDTIPVTGDIGTIYINDEGEVIVVEVNDDGTTTEKVISTDVDDVEGTLIKDEEGHEYVVTKDGTVMGIDEYKATGGKPGNVDNYNQEREAGAAPTVLFTKADNQYYGFDAYAELKANIQDQYPKLTENYRPAYKSVASFMPDAVTVTGQNDNTIFKDEMGIPALRTGNTLTVMGGPDQTLKSLYAFTPINDTTQQMTGKLNLKSYTPETKTLYIVSVNGAQLPSESDLQNTLNTIYKQAVIKWEVKPGNPLTDIAFEGPTMSHGGSGVTSPYNKDQKTIINAYKSTNDVDENAYYLFFVSEVVDKEANIAGYMPLTYHAGFIYGFPSNTTIAHELGHGAFHLRHTFSTEGNKYIGAEGTTQNLMDYAGGSELWVHQWNYIHDPEYIVFAWGQDESEGQAFNTDGSNSLCINHEDAINALNEKYHDYYLPDGRKVNFQGKYKVSGFFGSTDRTSPGAVANIKANGYDYKHVFTRTTLTNGIEELTTTGYGFNFTNSNFGPKIDIDKFIADISANAVTVIIDKEQGKIFVKGAGIDDVIEFNKDCNCQYWNISECEYLWEITKRDPDAKGHEFTDPDNYFNKIVAANPCLLKDINTNPFYGVVIERDWASQEKYFKIVFLGGLAIGMAPVAIVELGSTVTTEYVAQKSGEFVIGAVVDGTLQVLISMILDGKTLDEAIEAVNIGQMARSGIENIIAADYLKATLSCVGDGLFKTGFELKDNITAEGFAWDCTIGAMSALLADEVSKQLGDAVTRFHNSVKQNPRKFIAVLERLGIPQNKIDEILGKFKIPTSSLRSIDELLASLEKKIDGDVWEAFKADFGNDADLLQLFDDKIELVGSWKVLNDLGHEARLNADLLKKIADATPEQKQALSTFYSNMAHPAGFKGKVNYSAIKTINGKSVTVKYDEYGFPVFKEFSPGEHTFIKSENYTGIYESDNLIANEGLIKILGEDNVWFNPAGNGSPVSIKIDGKWEEFTWHHLQDGKTMIPVKQDIHNSFNHSGGKQAIDSGLKGFFEY